MLHLYFRVDIVSNRAPPWRAKPEEIVMRAMGAAIVVLFSLGSVVTGVRAEQSKSCQQQCRDQRQACSKNYAGKACTTEYDICMKGCRAKK
jgi:hypothetical protein